MNVHVRDRLTRILPDVYSHIEAGYLNITANYLCFYLIEQ